MLIKASFVYWGSTKVIDLFNAGVSENCSQVDDDEADFDVYITDCSQNGTYVNGELVGKWKVSVLIRHNFGLVWCQLFVLRHCQ